MQQGAEDNGVWRMMVAASSLHEQQSHNLDLLRQENSDLKNRIDGHYAKPEARLREDVLGKRKADTELEYMPAGHANANIWTDFATTWRIFRRGRGLDILFSRASVINR